MMHVNGLLHPRQTYLIQSGDREGTQQSFILGGGGKGPLRGPTPYSYIYRFRLKLYPFRITLYVF